MNTRIDDSKEGLRINWKLHPGCVALSCSLKSDPFVNAFRRLMEGIRLVAGRNSKRYPVMDAFGTDMDRPVKEK